MAEEPPIEPSTPFRPAVPRPPSAHISGALAALALTPLAIAIHGFHPYAEDGGLYVAGIKRLLHPELYAASAPFVEAHLRYSLFAPFVAALVKVTHLDLPTVLLLLHFLSIWATLFAFRLVAERTLATPAARSGAVLLLALWLTVPVAGTSLVLVDPYVTARSVSLPCTLFALAGTFSFMRGPNRIAGALLASSALIVAAAMHPLMAGYALAATLLLGALLSSRRRVRRWLPLVLCLAAVAVSAILQHTAPPDAAAYLPIALSRYYWFLSRWRWYEIAGLAAPLAILSYAALRSGPAKPLAQMTVLAGATATLIASLFAHTHSVSHLVARLQPLRIFQLVYLVMILFLGGLLGEHILRAHRWRWLAATLCFGAIFFAAERAVYPASAHLEWGGGGSILPWQPAFLILCGFACEGFLRTSRWRTLTATVVLVGLLLAAQHATLGASVGPAPTANQPVNAWEQAFLWIAHNTPVDALFALDADYISAPGEDAQSFRALAERSALPDYSKDGGEASITPALTAAWTVGQKTQTNLSGRSDAERLVALRPLNVTWVVLQRGAQTGFVCPFTNAAVEVCHLPSTSSGVVP